MANAVFGWPIWSDGGVLYTPALSGGDWETALPLENVQDRRLSLVARSVDDDPTNTQFEIDLGVERDVRVLALILPNLSSAGTVRVRGSTTAGDFDPAVYDSGTITVYPSGETAETMGEILPTFIDVPSSAQAARYWLVEIDDEGNADGYVDVARLVIAGEWEPSKNFRYGAMLGLETESTQMTTDGGATIHRRRPVRRTWTIEIGALPDSEGLQSAHRMLRIAGTDGQIFFVANPDDDAMTMHERSFLCVARTLSPLQYATYNKSAMAFQLVEEL